MSRLERVARRAGAAQAPALGEVSWISPIARALLKAEVGDIVEIHTPKGSNGSRC